MIFLRGNYKITQVIKQPIILTFQHNSIYCRFTVVPDENNQVEIECVGIENYFGISLPSISGVFFDQPDTRITKFEYNDSTYPQEVTKTIDVYGNYTQTAYNPDGTLSQTRDKRGGITKYTYDADFPVPKITCVEDPMGFKRWTNYVKTPGAAYGKILSTVDARGSGPDDAAHMTSYEYDEKGNQTTVTDPMGNTTRYIYDSEGKLKESIDPTGYHAYYDIPSTSTEVKDALGRVISVTDKDGKTTYYEYDADSNLIKTTDPNGAVSTSQYDVLGRQVVSSDFEGNITRYEYDVMGRTTKTTGPGGSSTRFEYDAKGRQTKTIYSDDTYTETTYDIYGNTKTTRDRAGRITEFFYDRLNRTVKIKDPAGNFTYYQYDANGNRTAVGDPRSSGAADDTYKTSYTYDLNNRLTRIDYPDGTFETTTYDPNGNTLTKTDQKGQTTTYQYDNNNRTTKIIHPDQTTTEYSYDAGGRTIGRKDGDGSFTYYEILGNPMESHLSREYKIAGDGSLIYDYYSEFDSKGRLIKFLASTEAAIVKFNNVKYNETINKIGYTPTSTLGHHFTYGRQTEGGVPHRTYRQGTPEDPRIAWGKIKFGTNGIQYASAPGVLITSYEYDNSGKLFSLKDPFGKIYRFESINRTSTLYYPNNTYTESKYDSYGRLSRISHRRTEPNSSASLLEEFIYQYDDNNNITRITTAKGEYTDYTYDSLDRLTSEEKKTASGSRIYRIEYKFDNNDAKNGNIHQVVVNDTQTTTFNYNAMNQLIQIVNPDSSTETLAYDNNGNLTQSINNITSEITEYTWDCFDRMIETILPDGEYMEFAYDGNGMLVKDVSDGSERKFIQNNRFASREYIKNQNGSFELAAHHIIQGKMLSSYIHSTSNSKLNQSISGNSSSENVFYHTDHLGSVRLITDQNGNVIDSISTDAYGNPIPKQSKLLQEFNFVGTHGIRYLEKIRMHNMRARWYSGLLNRFISEDPRKYIDGLNLIAYVQNNPLIFIDRDGEAITIFQAYDYIRTWNNAKLMNNAQEFTGGRSLKNNKFDDIFSDSFFVCMMYVESTFKWSNKEPWGFMQIYHKSGAIGRIEELVEDWGLNINAVIPHWSAYSAKTDPNINIATGIWYLYHERDLFAYGTTPSVSI